MRQLPRGEYPTAGVRKMVVEVNNTSAMRSIRKEFIDALFDGPDCLFEEILRLRAENEKLRHKVAQAGRPTHKSPLAG